MADLQQELESFIAEHGTSYVVDVLASAIAMSAKKAQREYTPIEVQITKLGNEIATEEADVEESPACECDSKHNDDRDHAEYCPRWGRD